MNRHYSGPAEALLAVVEDDVLAGRGSREWRVKPYVDAVLRLHDAAGRVRLAVADPRSAAELRAGRPACDPVRRGRRNARAVQRRVVRPLHDDQRIAREVFRGHEPRPIGRALAPADAEPAALAQRVALEAAVAADDFAVGRLDRAGPAREPAAHEIAERALADEADAGGIPFVRDRQAPLAGDAPHLRLAQASDREFAGRELPGIERVQEIALVLAAVDAAQQPPAVGAGVMAGRETLGAEPARVVERDAELDLAVAEHVRVRRPPGLELGEEGRKYALAVLGREARPVQRDAEFVAHPPCILEVSGGRAVAVVVLRPVRHEQGLDTMPGLQEERC